MTNKGFLIRFIDIGLIVLFGFVMISDIDELSQVELSAAAEADSVQVDREPPVFVTVSITEKGEFDVALEDLTIAAAIPSVDTLRQVLLEARDSYASDDRETVVLIQPDLMSTVQKTVDVMDLCESLGIPRSLQANLDRATAGGQA